MASPEVIESSGVVDGASQGTLSAPEGWAKLLVAKKGGTPNKKDVVYVAPDGEEIKTKRQLEKYLKNHPGGPTSADFDWSTGETPRRSARLSTKGRVSSDTELESDVKRARVEEDEETVVVSPRKASKRKAERQNDIDAKGDAVEAVDKPTDGDATATNDVLVDAVTVEEKVQAPENDTDGKIEGLVTVGDVEMGEPIEQVPLKVSELTSVADAKNEVNSEEQVPKIEEPTTVIAEAEEVLRAEEPHVVAETGTEQVPAVAGLGITDRPPAPPSEMPAVEEIAKPSEGETLNEDVLYVPTAEKKDGDSFKPQEHIEIQGVHALIDEPVLSGVGKSPEQQTDPSHRPAERVDYAEPLEMRH